MKNRCNARPRAPPPCFSLNVNCTLPLSAEELEFQKNIFSHQKIFSQPWIARVQLKDLSKNELDQLIEKVTDSHRNTVPEIPVEILTHPSAEKKR
jgi:tRNA:m4X modification enzyme